VKNDGVYVPCVYRITDEGRQNDTVGILEMGGASTQIAFYPTGNVLADKFPVNIGQRRYPLYVHSYLDYGQDNLVRWIKQHIYNETRRTSSARIDQLEDPCMFTGKLRAVRRFYFYNYHNVQTFLAKSRGCGHNGMNHFSKNVSLNCNRISAGTRVTVRYSCGYY
jgi:GDA1/CD39 (nucleoside phosphatase) family